jgi:hypothetical protein
MSSRTEATPEHAICTFLRLFHKHATFLGSHPSHRTGTAARGGASAARPMTAKGSDLFRERARFALGGSRVRRNFGADLAADSAETSPRQRPLEASPQARFLVDLRPCETSSRRPLGVSGGDPTASFARREGLSGSEPSAAEPVRDREVTHELPDCAAFTRGSRRARRHLVFQDASRQ